MYNIKKDKKDALKKLFVKNKYHFKTNILILVAKKYNLI